jgi:hypothetical protein
VASDAGKMEVFPAFPEFIQVPVEGDYFLTKITLAGHARRRVTPARMYRGRIQPFESDATAVAVSRLLETDRPIDVHGGFLLEEEVAKVILPKASEAEISGATRTFDILAVEFEHTPDPWAFVVSPRVSVDTEPRHPHLRADRELIWEGKRYHGLCVYSAAEFSLARPDGQMSEFLRQVSIFLGKHIIWKRSGKWLGKVALSGAAHLGLPINGPCWCGDGKIYRNCCLPGEILKVLRTIKGITVPKDLGHI